MRQSETEVRKQLGMAINGHREQGLCVVFGGRDGDHNMMGNTFADQIDKQVKAEKHKK